MKLASTLDGEKGVNFFAKDVCIPGTGGPSRLLRRLKLSGVLCHSSVDGSSEVVEASRDGAGLAGAAEPEPVGRAFSASGPGPAAAAAVDCLREEIVPCGIVEEEHAEDQTGKCWQNHVDVVVASRRPVACTPLRAEPLVPDIDVGNQPF